MQQPSQPPSFRSSRAPAPGFFVQWDRLKRLANSGGQDIIDLSVGASDLLPQHEPIETLQAATEDPSTYSYCLKSGTMELLNAACAWYNRRYGLQLNPETEALTLVGSQEGLAHLLLGVTEHGDSVLMTNVAYPSYWGALQIAGLHPVFLPLDATTQLPDFDRIHPDQLSRVKVMLLNYPNNPTTVTADDAFFQAAIEFCTRHSLLLVHDNPYVDQVYEGQAPSPLCLPGGRSCCVELFSFAKSHHLAGFRLGFALGAADAIAALESVKAPIDFNQYKGIQLMGVTCLSLPEDRVKADAQVWRKRAACMVQALQEQAGWTIHMPKSGMYLWAPLPSGLPPCAASEGQASDSAPSDLLFCQRLLADTGVALSPGSGFGGGFGGGEGFVRFALVANEGRLQEAARRIGAWLRRQQVL